MENIKLLILEDCEEDYLLLIHKLKEEGLSFDYKIVNNEIDFENAISEKWDLILADYALPSYSGLTALRTINKLNIDIPFILVSGAIGEEQAVEIIKEGAADYLNKNNLKRLIPVIQRELEDAELRRSKKEAEEKLLQAHKELEYKVRLRTEELRVINDQLFFEIEQKETIEKELKQSIYEFKTLANTVPNIIIKVDFENNKKFYNNRLYDYLGIRRGYDEILDYESITHPDDDFAKKYQNVLTSTKGEIKVRIKSSLGEYRWFLVKYHNEFSSEGKIKNLFLTATDIQDLVNAQEEAFEKDRRFKILQEVSPNGFLILKPFFENGKIVDFIIDYLNPAGIKLVNASSNVIGRSYGKALHKDYLYIVDICREVYEKNNTVVNEICYEFDNKKFWFKNIICRIDNNVAITFADITESKSIEKIKEEALLKEQTARILTENALHNLEQAKEEYRIMGETIPCGIWKTDANGGALYTSQSFLDLLDMTMEEMQQFGWTKKLVPEDLEPMFNKWMNCINTGKPWDHIHRIIDKKGKINYILSKGLPVKDKDENITSWVGINLDITDKMEVEKELEKTRENFKEVLTRVGDSIIAVDNDYKISYLNSAATKYFNYLMDEYNPIGLNFWEVYPQLKNTLYEKFLNIALNEQCPVTFEMQSPLTEKWFMTSMYPSKNGVTIFAKDIQEMKNQEENLKNSLKEKEFLLREIHHRIKNNLQIIVSLLSLQSNYISDPKALEYFVESQNRIRSMAIVHEQLHKSRQISSVNIRDYIKELCGTITSSYQGDVPAFINFDIEDMMLSIEESINIGLIINELVLNSIKHAFKGRDKGEINIKFQLIDDDEAILEVKDDGIGLPKDIDVMNTESFGLQLVTAMTDQLGGKLEIINNNGCSFKMKLKIKNLNLPKEVEDVNN